ncbi:MAG: choice-of-anchor L domain-containing protein [Bacteroidia bacterium]
MKIKKIPLFFALLLCVFTFNTHAQLTTKRSGNYGVMTYLVNNILLGNGTKATNITYQGIDTAFGFFNGISSNIGMDSGLLITNGTITNANGPSCRTDDSKDGQCTTYYPKYPSQEGWPNSNSYNDSDLANLLGDKYKDTYSCFIIQFDFVATSDSIRFQYVFGSNEEPCFYNDKYFDDFGFFLSGPGINGHGGKNGPFSHNAENLALIPGTSNAVSINNVNCSTNSNYYVCNWPTSAPGCTEACSAGCPASIGATTVGYSGFTKVLTARAAVKCGQTYHIKLGVADIENGYYDSGVFLKAGSFENNAVSVVASPASAKICGAGKSVTLTADGATNYTWNTGGTNDTIMVSPTTTTTYSVVGNISTGCADTGKIVVTVNPAITATVTPTNGNCAAKGSATVTASGGSDYTYSWSNGKTTQSDTGLTAGKYIVTVTDSAGCSTTDTTVIISPVAPVITVSPSSKSICSGNPVSLTASGGSTYTWSPATGLSCTTCSNTNADPAVTTTYKVVGDSSGCSDSATTTITVISNTNVIAWGDTIIAAGGTAVISASGAIRYTWSPGENIGCDTCPVTKVTPGATTTYTVIGTNTNGCTSTDTVTVIIECNDFEVPNVFTPNNDGINDVFLIKAYSETSYSIEIYNRWGILMFKSNSPASPWNGKDMSGQMVSDGVYYYIIKSKCSDTEYDHHGFVQVIR